MVSPPTRTAGTGAHRLQAPCLADVRTALDHLPGRDGAALWADVLLTAGLVGTESDLEDVARAIGAMSTSADPVVALRARALRTRLMAFHHLTTLQHRTREDSP